MTFWIKALQHKSFCGRARVPEPPGLGPVVLLQRKHVLLRYYEIRKTTARSCQHSNVWRSIEATDGHDR
jgi:hypothetical protein